jgi:Protein of unknown function (DUF2806)
MSDDIAPRPPLSSLDNFLEKLNLPEMIAGPAGKAISRLVAGAVEIPTTYLEGFVQSIKSKTEGKQLVAKEVATAAAKLASSDTNIVARAAHNLLAKEYRHQKNKEDIAKKTIEILEQDAAQGAAVNRAQSISDGQASSASPEVDGDWLNVFEKYAEDASTERMQALWARILAGEIRTPRTFSLKTLRFVSELDQETARLFEKYLRLVCNNTFLPRPQLLQGPELTELLHLEAVGLLTGVTGLLSQTFQCVNGLAAIYTQGRLLVITAESGQHTFQIPSAMLTKTGSEVSWILQLPFSPEHLKELVARIPKGGIKSIVRDGDAPEILWPEPEQHDAAPAKSTNADK